MQANSNQYLPGGPMEGQVGAPLYGDQQGTGESKMVAFAKMHWVLLLVIVLVAFYLYKRSR